MNTRPLPHKRSHLKHPRGKSASSTAESTWLRRFWLSLGCLVLILGAMASYQHYQQGLDEEEEDVYFSLKTMTTAGDNFNVICKLSLLIDPEQENRITKRQQQLETVVNATLAEVYEGDNRPALEEVRKRLRLAINERLPRKLQIRDVYIQELLIGNS